MITMASVGHIQAELTKLRVTAIVTGLVAIALAFAGNHQQSQSPGAGEHSLLVAEVTLDCILIVWMFLILTLMFSWSEVGRFAAFVHALAGLALMGVALASGSFFLFPNISQSASGAYPDKEIWKYTKTEGGKSRLTITVELEQYTGRRIVRAEQNALLVAAMLFGFAEGLACFKIFNLYQKEEHTEPVRMNQAPSQVPEIDHSLEQQQLPAAVQNVSTDKPQPHIEIQAENPGSHEIMEDVQLLPVDQSKPEVLAKEPQPDTVQDKTFLELQKIMKTAVKICFLSVVFAGMARCLANDSETEETTELGCIHVFIFLLSCVQKFTFNHPPPSNKKPDNFQAFFFLSLGSTILPLFLILSIPAFGLVSVVSAGLGKLLGRDALQFQDITRRDCVEILIGIASLFGVAYGILLFKTFCVLGKQPKKTEKVNQELGGLQETQAPASGFEEGDSDQQPGKTGLIEEDLEPESNHEEEEAGPGKTETGSLALAGDQQAPAAEGLDEGQGQQDQPLTSEN